MTSSTLSRRVRHSGPTGWQVPPIFIRQTYVESLYKEALDFLADLGLHYDEWQQLILREMLGIKADGTWASPDFGLVVGRQNGKSEVAIARILVGLFLIKEPLIVYSAHLADTASEIFLRLVSIVGDKDDEHNPNRWLHAYIKHVWFANGKQGIEVEHPSDDGSAKLVCRLKIKTRTGGGGRGFTANCLILDEAMVLTHAFMAALGPTQSAVDNPQMIVMGSAGTQDSESFGHLRRQAMAEGAYDITWMEWSADLCGDYCEPECTEHDEPFSEETYAKTNPSYGIRIMKAAIEKDRRNLDFAGFVIERLSVGDWPQELDEFGVIPREAWNDAEDGSLTVIGKPAFGIATDPHRAFSAIAVAGYADDAKTQVLIEITSADVVDMRPGTKWVIPRAKEINARHASHGFAIDEKTQAGTFVDALRRDGVRIHSPQAAEYARYCAKLKMGITGTKQEPRYIWHLGQHELTTAVAAASERKLSGMWAWAKATDAAVIVALEAVTVALWCLETQSEKDDDLWVV